jgi:hypothetical protein
MGGPVLSPGPFGGGGPPSCPTAAAAPNAMQSRPTTESSRAVLAPRMLICLDKVFALRRGGRSARSAAALCRN